MPRKQTEADAFKDIYMLTVEKERLAQELVSIEQRRRLICQRMDELEQEARKLVRNARDIRQAKAKGATQRLVKTVRAETKHQAFDTQYIEY